MASGVVECRLCDVPLPPALWESSATKLRAVPIDDQIVEWVRNAVADASSWSEVGTTLRALDADGDDPRLRPFVIAFSYALHEYFSSARDRAGGPFGAMIAGEGWRFPPALGEIPDAEVEAWRDALGLLEHPVAQARLGDLLWERKSTPDPHLAAWAACDALVSIADDARWHTMERMRCLSRALELARDTHDATRQATVAAAMVAFAEHDLAGADGGPGVSLGALRPLVTLSPEQRPKILDDLLQRVGQKYGGDPYIADSVADARSALLGEEGDEQLRREQVQRWKEEAEKGDGMLRVHRLEHALEIARRHGLKAEADRLRRELGSIGPDELGLQTISTEIEIPAEEVERFMTGMDEAETWQIALKILAAQGAPGGSPEDLGQHVDQLMGEFPFQFLVSKSLVGPDNASAIFRADTPDRHRRLALSEQRAQQARVWGMICARALMRIGSRGDRPDRAALTDFFDGGFVDVEVAERVACAVELFWDRRFDESAHVLVPRLERIIREMARQVGIPIVREPHPGREIGSVETLGALLGDLGGAFGDAAWHAYLVNLLADPLGLNLRNGISHGLHGTIGPVDSSLLIQAAVLLSMLSLQPIDSPPEPPPGAGPAD